MLDSHPAPPQAARSAALTARGQSRSLRPHMNPEGLIFDCDGTLADTMPLHWRVWRALAQKHGFAFTETRFYALGGVPTRDIIALLAREQGLSLDHLAIAKEKEFEYLRLLQEIEPIHSIVEIARAHRGRLPMAVATGGTRRVIEQVLDRLGIRDWFAAVVTSEDVQRQKPAPDIFLEAARRLGVPPERCRAYEDTDLGMQAIRAAGMDAVDVRELLPAPPGS
jgi:beta-phosphoglucomutase family hydrolase